MRGRSPPAAALVAVAAGWSVLQLALVGHVGLGWDETVYTSQVADVPAAFFSAPRARGISWLVAPVAAVSSDPGAIRGYLALASGVGLVVTYWPWLRLHRGPVVPLAAGLFAVLWVSLFYGPAVMPNLWVALAAVAATGWFLRAGSRPAAAWPLVAMALAVGAAALLRPLDAVVLAAALLVAVLVVARWRDWRRLLGIGCGLATGLSPWVIEAVTSYGGVLERLHAGARVEGGLSPQWSVGTALSAVDGPALCRPCLRSLPMTGLGLWLGGLVAVALACWLAWRDGRLETTTLPTAVGFAMALPYLFLIDYNAPRFLQPAYALLVLPVALALAAWWASRRLRLRGLVAVIVVGLLVYQMGVLAAIVRGSDRQREAWAKVAATLSAHGVRPPCKLTGSAAVPLAFYAGCDSAQLSGPDRSTSVTGLLRTALTQRVAVLARDGARVPTWAQTWSQVRVSTGLGGWALRLAPTRWPNAGS